jgi:hypothetical protein
MKNSKNPVQELLSISAPLAWKDWLVHIQNNLIADGYVEQLTEEGRHDMAARMQGLYDFFGQIDQKKKQA